MERLRQAVWHGLEDKLGGEKIGLQYMTSTLTGGRVFTAPTAYLRPSISSHGRGKPGNVNDKLFKLSAVLVKTILDI